MLTLQESIPAGDSIATTFFRSLTTTYAHIFRCRFQFRATLNRDSDQSQPGSTPINLPRWRIAKNRASFPSHGYKNLHPLSHLQTTLTETQETPDAPFSASTPGPVRPRSDENYKTNPHPNFT